MPADVPPLFQFRRPGRRAVALLISAATLAAGCTATKTDFLVLKLGGDTTAKALRGRPFNQSARNLTNDQLRTFGAGADVFDADAVPPALGPTFNATGCLGCHLDGTQDPATVTQPPGLLIRLGTPPVGDPTYGTQLQTQPDGVADATVTYRFVDDGALARLVADVAPNHGPLAPDTTMSIRMAPPIIGLGLLEAIPESTIRAAADPGDANGDGISGRINEVWDNRLSQMTVGRFGWKAGQPSVAQQTVVALHDDMGVTSSAQPDPCARQGTRCIGRTGAVEMSDSRLADMIFYNRTIAVPIAADVESPDVVAGARLFVDSGCASCHTTTQTSAGSDIAANANQTFHPYTDLLLHDMGSGLADGRPEFAASGTEWRTAPLWGIGRRFGVWGIHAYLHDGRARSIEEAIRWHGGEGERARVAFEHLSPGDRRRVLAFLDSL